MPLALSDRSMSATCAARALALTDDQLATIIRAMTLIGAETSCVACPPAILRPEDKV
jgi:hypothetical protein